MVLEVGDTALRVSSEMDLVKKEGLGRFYM
jgi:hypothetical protein